MGHASEREREREKRGEKEDGRRREDRRATRAQRKASLAMLAAHGICVVGGYQAQGKRAKVHDGQSKTVMTRMREPKEAKRGGPKQKKQKLGWWSPENSRSPVRRSGVGGFFFASE